MNGFFLIARNELLDSLRSRRLWAVALLYLVAAVASTLLFITFLQNVEKELATALQLKPAAGTGSTTQALWRSASFRHMLTGLVQDRALAERLLSVPPLALFYGWFACAFAPAFVVLTAAPRIAEEVGGGAARYALFRTTRLSWCLGKTAGQAVQILLALLASAAGAWCCGWLRMDAFPASASALAMLGMALRAWIFALAYLGLATGISQLCASPNLALALGFACTGGLAILSQVAAHYAGTGWARLWDLVHVLTPGAHRSGLWWNDPAHLLPSACYLLALGALYLIAGYLRLARRDL